MKIAPRRLTDSSNPSIVPVGRLGVDGSLGVGEGVVRSPEVCQTVFANDGVRWPYLIFSDKRTGGISAGRQIAELTAGVYQKRIS